MTSVQKIVVILITYKNNFLNQWMNHLRLSLLFLLLWQVRKRNVIKMNSCAKTKSAYQRGSSVMEITTAKIPLTRKIAVNTQKAERSMIRFGQFHCDSCHVFDNFVKYILA